MPFGVGAGEILIMFVVLAIGVGLFWFIGAIVVRTVLRFTEELRGEDSGPHGG